MDRRFALLLACFFLSGFAALLYQTAWTRELSFVFGTSELAVAAVLAAYMGGLALGAAAAARYALRVTRPVLAYGLLELAIAISALLVPVGIAGINAVYVALLGGGRELVEAGVAAAVFQLGAAFAVLLPPTAFMGATLPLLARHAVRSEAEIGSRVGVLYAVNTAGAIAGTLCAAFWLMPALGLRLTVWVGALLNGVVFLLAARLARGAAPLPAPGAAPVAPEPAPPQAWIPPSWILPAIAVSGAVSFAYEVLWTRLLGQVFGASVQAFATMLASFLLGIALGSAVAARLATSRTRAALGFGVAQLGTAIASYAGLALADRLPELSNRLGAGPGDPLASAAVAALPLLPITLCIGATFPFAVRLLARHPDQAAAATARVYAWNTVGAIVGALGAGFVLLPGLGFEGTLVAGAAANLALALLAALAVRPRRTGLAAAAAVAGLALLLVPARAPLSLLRHSPMTGVADDGEVVFLSVGRSSTVLVFDRAERLRLATNGLPESSILRRGALPRRTVARWLGGLPALLRPEARELLVVGLGGGVALELVPSTMQKIDVIELEPEVLEANRHVGPERAIDPLLDPRVRVVIADARGALQLTSKRYDAIVSQPSHPWTAGASHLYTREFFSLVRSRLAPDGVFVQWIGLKFVDEALLRSLVATLVDVFAHVEVHHLGSGGLLFASSDAPLGLAGPEQALRTVPDDFARFGVHRIEDVAAFRALDARGARAFARGAPLNTDDHNLLAARAARLGDDALDLDSVAALMEDLDPLLARGDELDFGWLIRDLVDLRFQERATAIALAAGGADEELGLGWIEWAKGRPARAARHFARVLELDPEASEARAGLLNALSPSIAQGGGPPVLLETDPDGALAVVIAGLRHSAAGDWDAVAALDADLAKVAPGESLFEKASRLRIRWRLERGDAASGQEALAIADALLQRRWSGEDTLLRAAAAISAGRPEVAWAELEGVAAMPQAPGTRRLAGRALETCLALPDETAGDLCPRLARIAGRAEETPTNQTAS
ncbi:MAG: fused MFS/spermidine synthase [Myxococcota bacterium]|nr:fused MFS/spermidine synthase [Myxococcota bacterium]